MRKLVLCGALALLFGCAAVSRYPVAPRWTVHLQDAEGLPTAGVQVTERWVGKGFLSESKLTNAEGNVTFEERSIRGGLFVRTWVSLRRTAIAQSEDFLVGQVPIVTVTDTSFIATTMYSGAVGTREEKWSTIVVSKR